MPTACCKPLYVVGQVWVGSWNLLLYYFPEGTNVAPYSIGYWLGGQVLLVLTQCYLNLSWVDVCPALMSDPEGMGAIVRLLRMIFRHLFHVLWAM